MLYTVHGFKVLQLCGSGLGDDKLKILKILEDN